MNYAARQPIGIDVKALVYAVLLHLLIAALLLVNFTWSGRKTPANVPPMILARVVLDQPKSVPVRQQAPKATVPSDDASVKKKADADALAKKQAAEKKKQAAEQKRRRDAAAKKRHEEARQQMLRELEAEEKERKTAAAETRAEQAMAKFERLIVQRVTRNWIRPTGAAGDLNCLVRVRLAAGGEVLAVRVIRSSGNALFDRSVENAVYKASPLPVPDDPELFQYIREINLNFDPETK